ncbi:MAG TPA: response regulator, partial [Candidatus Acidoferrum sp.]|nr:response regulator [Candidatus Acidoferrum sp.]
RRARASNRTRDNSMTSGLSVLIVDDDPGALHLLQAILQDAGFVVRTADRPGRALRLVEEAPPDLLITDLRMPEMSGVELLQAAQALRPDLCCLVITGFATDQAIAEAFRAGARDLLLKPIHLEEVQARVRNAAEVVQLRREVRLLREACERASSAGPRPEVNSRARELTNLPALPGSAAPVAAGGRDAVFTRLERLAGLFRQGVITPAEYEEKKRGLLTRI